MKKLLILVSLILLLFFCFYMVYPILVINNSENYPDTIEYIVRWDYDYSQSMLYSRFGLTYSTADAVKDTKLQKAVSQIEISYPLEDDEVIRQYMWEVYEILLKRKLISPELVPTSAEKYEGDIWYITYSESGDAYDGSAACALVSAIDGHLIYLSTEDIIAGKENKGYGE